MVFSIISFSKGVIYSFYLFTFFLFSNIMNSEFCSASSCPVKLGFGFGFSFIDFILFMIVLFFLSFPVSTTSCSVPRYEVYGCSNLPLCSENCVVPKKEIVGQELEEKTHQDMLQKISNENQLLIYELEQAKLKYSIEKLRTETKKLSVSEKEIQTIIQEE